MLRMMKNTQWIKPGIWGAIVGAVAVVILGFAVFGWVRGSTAAQMATTQASNAVLAVQTPYCVAKAVADPMTDAKRLELAALTSLSQRQDYVAKAGWATPDGATDASRPLAALCAKAIGELPAA
jgi:hypothetical protein